MKVMTVRLGSTVPIWDWGLDTRRQRALPRHGFRRVRNWNARGSAIAWLRLSKTSYYLGDNIIKLVLSYLKHQSTKNRKRVPHGISWAPDRGNFLVSVALRSEFPPLGVHQNHGGFNLAFGYAPVFLEQLVLLLRTN